MLDKQLWTTVNSTKATKSFTISSFLWLQHSREEIIFKYVNSSLMLLHEKTQKLTLTNNFLLACFFFQTLMAFDPWSFNWTTVSWVSQPPWTWGSSLPGVYPNRATFLSEPQYSEICNLSVNWSIFFLLHFFIFFICNFIYRDNRCVLEWYWSPTCVRRTLSLQWHRCCPLTLKMTMNSASQKRKRKNGKTPQHRQEFEL